METNKLLSLIFGIVSLAFYSVLYIPQARVILKNKSSDGISLDMIVLWNQGSAISLMGTILLQLPIQFVVIGWYLFLCSCTMTLLVLYYRTLTPRTKHIYYTGICLLVLSDIAVCIVLHIIQTPNPKIIGFILGWITATVFTVGRTTQLYLNYRRQSTQGLSILMYISCIMADTCFATSILTYSLDWTYLYYNMPWLVLITCSITLDSIVLTQTLLYNQKTTPA
jgi:uncharacterized protein with PQ loop repeat